MDIQKKINQMEHMDGELINLFSQSIHLRHNISDKLVSVTTTENWEYRFTKQIVQLEPSCSSEMGEHIVNCRHCGKAVFLNLTASTYALINHSLLTNPITGPLVRRFLWRRERFKFIYNIGAPAIFAIPFGLLLATILFSIIGLDLSGHWVGSIAIFSFLLALLIGTAIAKKIQIKNLRTKFVFIELSKKPTNREKEISHLNGVTFYRLITNVRIIQTGVSDHALSGANDENIIYTYAKSINIFYDEEFEKFVRACEQTEHLGDRHGIKIYECR